MFHINHRKRRTLLLLLALLLIVPRGAHSSGFQIPNQSLKAIGSAGANIAFTTGPDAAYYNPANISLLPDGNHLEASLTTLWLPEISYRDNRNPSLDGESDFEIFYLPQLHYASRDYNGIRFGFSLTYPYGLAKNWDQPFPQGVAEKFSLTVVEANPSIAYKLNDQWSIAGGLRLVYAKGEIRSTAANPPYTDLPPSFSIGRDIEADDIAFGYNLATTYQPMENWRLAATFRSAVDLELDGDATLIAAFGGFILPGGYDGSAGLDLTLPPVFSLATSYTFGDLTCEIAWSRTFWSEIDELDFRFDQSFTTPPFAIFDQPVEKVWDDSDALRFGLTYIISKTLTATAGFAIDQTPIPEKTVNFDLPDSDAYMYGLGMQYSASENLRLGISYMYYHTSSRTVKSSATGLDGKFDDGGAHAITVGVITRL